MLAGRCGVAQPSREHLSLRCPSTDRRVMSSFLSPSVTRTDVAAERVYLREVFAWMVLALALTTGVGAYLDSSGAALRYFNAHPGMLWLLFGAQLALVIGLSFAFSRISAQVAAVVFCLYAG